jgi:hypothetical protein
VAAGKRLLRELLACNSWGVQAVEQQVDTAEKAGALVQLAWGFGLLSAVLSQREYQAWDGAEEQGEKEEGMEKEKEKEKEKETEVHTEEADGKGKEKVTEVEAESDIVVLEGG